MRYHEPPPDALGTQPGASARPALP